MKNKEAIETKVLYIVVTKDLHHEIKTQASWRNITIKKYIIQAIVERMKRDAGYQ